MCVCVGGCSVCVWKVWCVYEHVRVHGVCVCVCDVFAREPQVSTYLTSMHMTTALLAIGLSFSIFTYSNIDDSKAWERDCVS